MNRGTYTRWTRKLDQRLHADLLGTPIRIHTLPGTSTIRCTIAGTDLDMTPDEARLYGVRLIEAAALADGEHAIRTIRCTDRPAT